MYEGHKVSAIVTCAGKGTRFGSNKLLVELDGMTIIERTVRSMMVPIIDEVVVTVSPEHEAEYRRILVEEGGLEVTFVHGGAERHLSAMNGLEATTGDIVITHDGVRPFATAELIERVVSATVEHGAAMLGMPSTVQVKLVSDDGFIEGSLDRSHSWLGQTPQGFKRELLDHAYRQAVETEYSRVSDDADLVAEFAGTSVRIVEGHVNNIKITTPQDLGTARLIVEHLVEDE
ncbi:IspD/TarI family cytidylyltransferase [Agromyces cerinus]|uniref:2-C-methyl-D-erythritol 4-phosphate cytidylyltransferase n=1 Tax=Agromyces cerinus subsp. cerinus TaxID=232089 RepID=A0A1N6DIJ3_9MICO|nr:IspD/TarI family cytidylyltransferase [Agromyces cerinus]SIN70547.1 2-C-methyl-D-erythritol 4-phosphate cytidylyltransferase [Agromyces cerinus subsp. cerinus]